MEDKNTHTAILGGGCITLIVALLVLLLAFCGCKTIETVREMPVITEHTTVQHHTDIIRDTLMMRDSVYHYVQGDTVIIERWHQAININKVVVADTIRDTIPKIVTVTQTQIKEVEKPLHWWQKLLMFTGGFLFILVIGWLIIKFKF